MKANRSLPVTARGGLLCVGSLCDGWEIREGGPSQAGGLRHLFAVALLAAAPLAAQASYVYIGKITSESVLIAWGNTGGVGGRNTIGRDSVSMGRAEVKIGGRTLTASRNWIDLHGLAPDTTYPYELFVGRRRIGATTSELIRRMPIVCDYS